ncbi:MAG: hypothetical protein KC422_00095 [Trueperaceae bacterium]|nr:hypothetical protein [Trueperaceae bacterium]
MEKEPALAGLVGKHLEARADKETRQEPQDLPRAPKTGQALLELNQVYKLDDYETTQAIVPLDFFKQDYEICIKITRQDKH